MENSDYYSWVCIGNEIWVLGFVVSNHVCDIQATIKRNKNGSWSWRILISNENGIEPSKKTAMEKVMSVMQLELV